MIRVRHAVASVLLCAFVVGCGASQDVTDESSNTIAPVATVGGVGSLPPADSSVVDSVGPSPASTEAPASTSGLLGDLADGNRVLLLGDSILASTSQRYGNHMCNTLMPLGWQVAVEAEPSRFVEFGNDVLDDVLRVGAAPVDDWNAAVVFLGSNYRGDPVAFEAQLRQMLTRLAPRPTLLLTVTEYRPDWSEVNEVVTRLADADDNVTLLDWKTIAEEPGVLSGDRLHPTDAGRQVLADAIAASLGPAPIDTATPTTGACLSSLFRDDSGVGSNAPDVLGPPSSTSTSASSSGSSSSGSSSSGSSGSGSSGSGSGSGGNTAPNTTAPTTTASTTTAPPAPTTTTTTTTSPPAPTPTPPPDSDGGETTEGASGD